MLRMLRVESACHFLYSDNHTSYFHKEWQGSNPGFTQHAEHVLGLLTYGRSGESEQIILKKKVVGT